MALPDSNVLKLAPDAAAPAYRSAPHNIEAEQGLLGAILVNNDAFYRVSDFLEPKHFFEPLHQTIFETAGSLIRMGKIATPVTLKTFLPADTDIGGMTIGQYLAPSSKHYPVARFVEPREFEAYATIATAKGFLLVAASPLTRSSHHAGDDFLKLRAVRAARHS